MITARIIHIFGIILWLGGGTLAALTMALLASETKDMRVAATNALRRLVLYMVTPGMLLAWGGGLAMLLPHWSELYAKAPWMHTKLTVGLIASALSGVLSGKLRKAAVTGSEVSPGTMRLVGGVLLLSAVAGVTLVMTRPS